MNRLAAVVAGVALALSTGCAHDGEWSVRKALGFDDAKHGPLPTGASAKDIPKLPPAAHEVSARVENLGRTIIGQNTFTGIDPLFTTVNIKDPLLFHRGTEQLWISQGLVEKCGSDAELAALLCAELGQMVVEKRAARAVGRDVDPIPDATTGGNALFPGGTAFDAGRQAELGYHERRFPKAASAPDATATARDLLKGAGYSPGELDRVESLLKQSDRGDKIRKQIGGSGPLPEWK